MLNDPRTGESYYAKRVSVPPEERKRLGNLKRRAWLGIERVVQFLT